MLDMKRSKLDGMRHHCSILPGAGKAPIQEGKSSPSHARYGGMYMARQEISIPSTCKCFWLVFFFFGNPGLQDLE
jgi:hypothetical protein